MNVGVVDEIAAIDAASWNALHGAATPFLRHEFIAAAEATGCVSRRTGWTPRHLVLHGPRGRLRGAMPLYAKMHSWGEFVFDWSWAHAYERAGLEYYPKLVSATPFTPAPSRRLLLADPADREAGAALVEAALRLAREEGYSSLHVQFPDPDELPVLEAAGLRLRKDCQFHWHNRGYREFDEFLATFSSKKRKNARRDRRRVAEQGIRFCWQDGGSLAAGDWEEVHGLISKTFLRRGSLPYLDHAFFVEAARRLPEHFAVLRAKCRSETVAAAVFYVGATTLYGRYWGSNGNYDALHFETCYYQGIDYCIEHGLETFNPGTQGEHKISRGFVPVSTWSAHWLARPEFFAAVGRYLDAEQQQVDEYIDAIRRHSPYRAGHGS